MEPSPSWEASTCESTQELPSILRNPKVHYGVLKGPDPLVLIPSQINQFIPPHSVRYILIWSTYLHLGLLSNLFPSDFLTNYLYAFLFFPFVLHAQLISFSLTWSIWLYVVKSTSYEGSKHCQCHYSQNYTSWFYFLPTIDSSILLLL
jgi:hypothetical protein